MEDNLIDTLLAHYNASDEEIVTAKLPNNKSFLTSLSNYFAKNENLSVKQENAFLDLIKRVIKHDDLLSIKYQKEEILCEVFYRYDYHGDPLTASKVVGLKRNYTKEQLAEEVQNVSAAQHSVESYVPKYEVSQTVDFPVGIIPTDKENVFAIYGFVDFNLAITKLRENKFRKVSTKNRTIRIIRQLLDSDAGWLTEADTDFLRGTYKHW